MAMGNGVRTRYSIAMHNDGGARVAVTVRCFGKIYETENKRFSGMTPEFFRRHFEKLASKLSPEATIFGKPEVDFSKYPGIVSYTVDVPDFASPIGKYLSFDLPGYRELLKIVDVGEERKTPYVNFVGDVRLEYEIILPENHRPTTRADGRRTMGAPGAIIYTGKSRSFGNRIYIGHQLLCYPGIIDSSESVAVDDIHRRLNRLHEWRIVLEPIREKGENL